MAYVGTPIDTQNQFQSLQGKRFSGDGSTTAFTLDIAPSSVFDIEVFVENVRQDPNSAYGVSGTTLTFTGAPPSGTNNIYVVHQAKAVGTIDVPANGVVPASLASNIISGQTELASEPADTDEFLISDAGTIKRIDYSLVKDGIKVADLWRQNTDTAINAATETVLTANWEQADTDGFGVIGTAMSESSGIFTFPQTGIYLIIFNCQIHSPSQGATYAGGIIQATTDNGTYSTAAEGYNSIYHSNGYGIVTIFHQFDVTSTSTHKVKFVANCEFASDVRGNTGYNRTCAQFIRLGDT